MHQRHAVVSPAIAEVPHLGPHILTVFVDEDIRMILPVLSNLGLATQYNNLFIVFNMDVKQCCTRFGEGLLLVESADQHCQTQESVKIKTLCTQWVSEHGVQRCENQYAFFPALTCHHEPSLVQSQATESISGRREVRHQLPGAAPVLHQGLRRSQGHIRPPTIRVAACDNIHLESKLSVILLDYQIKLD